MIHDLQSLFDFRALRETLGQLETRVFPEIPDLLARMEQVEHPDFQVIRVSQVKLVLRG